MSDQRDILADLAPRGYIRAAINYGNPVLARPDPLTGAPRGVSVDLAAKLAERLGVAVKHVTFDAAGKVFEALSSSAWDVALLAIDPVRAEQIGFTAPYVVIEGSYLVRDDSPIRTIADVDRHGVRVAVGRGAAYDLFLTRSLTNAELVRAETSAGAVDLFALGSLDAAAGVRQPLLAYAAAHPGYRVIDGRFAVIEQAMGTPRGGDAGLAFLRNFLEDAKRTGFVAAALVRHDQCDAAVAPLAAVA